MSQQNKRHDWLRRKAIPQLFCEHDWEILSARLALSPREMQILRAIVDNRKEMAIANQLKISIHTVRTHAERLKTKLGVTNRTTLLVRVFCEYLEYLRTDLAVPRHTPDRSDQPTVSSGAKSRSRLHANARK